MWIHVKLGWNQLNFELTVLLCTLCGSQEWDLQVFWNNPGPCAVTRSSCVSHVSFLEIRYNFPGLVCFLIAWENSQHFAMPLLVSPQNDVWETSAEIPYWWRTTTQNWIVLLIGWSKFPTRHDQSEAFPRSGLSHIISLEFLRWFVRPHFTGKPVVASSNVCCFLRLCF